VLDATFMSRARSSTSCASRCEDAKERGVLFSLHLKATMMKVSDPIIFGHAVRVFFADVFEKHGERSSGSA
jgi:isocitrate dehydrogenase